MNAATKHTAGPWQINGSHVYSADPERAMLAQVFNPGSKASDFPLVANARLIAAAPDLLEALVVMAQHHVNGTRPTIEERNDAFFAIAKATGMAA